MRVPSEKRPGKRIRMLNKTGSGMADHRNAPSTWHGHTIATASRRKVVSYLTPAGPFLVHAPPRSRPKRAP
jgi:hypothetical protein